jgi:hypothetical protein
MKELTLWILIFTMVLVLAALIPLVGRVWKQFQRLLHLIRQLRSPAAAGEATETAEPSVSRALSPSPQRRRRPSFYDTVNDFDSKRNWDGRLPPLYPDAVATGAYAQRRLAEYRNGTRAR